MLDFKDTESKVTKARRNVKITNVRIDGDNLVDEEGMLGERLANVLPVGIDSFDMKITFDLPEDDDVIAEEEPEDSPLPF